MVWEGRVEGLGEMWDRPGPSFSKPCRRPWIGPFRNCVGDRKLCFCPPLTVDFAVSVRISHPSTRAGNHNNTCGSAVTDKSHAASPRSSRIIYYA